MTSPGKFLPTALFFLLAVLSAAGVVSPLQDFLLVSPARDVTSAFELSAGRSEELVDSAGITVELLHSHRFYADHSHLLGSVADSLEFSRFAVSAAAIAVHVINIFLILSKPMGTVLLCLLFILLGVIRLVRRDRRLRNSSMALGTAAWVFIVAIPAAVTVSGGLTGIYTGNLRCAAGIRLEEFQENGEELVSRETAPGDARRDLIVLVKGLPNYIWFASASWLFDLILMPVFLSWAFYRLGIFLANTLFGSFRIQKIGSTLGSLFKKEAPPE